MLDTRKTSDLTLDALSVKTELKDAWSRSNELWVDFWTGPE